jgi:hypothetical protein
MTATSTKRSRSLLPALLAAAVLAAACGSAEPVDDDAAAMARGAAALAPFKKDLQTALRTGLAQGPVEAISACRIEAPRIAAEHSRDDIVVGRTSHRLRNPANAPRAWVAPLLDAYVAREADGPRVVPLGNGRIGYVEPILTQGLCLACHGSAPAETVADRIAALYPEDEAIGFAEGDLRGLFWAELPAPETAR